MNNAPTITIRPATWPDDEAVATGLLQNYAAHLAQTPEPILLEAYSGELATLAELWSEPHGVLLLAFFYGKAAGCVAVKVLTDPAGCCELKRLWVELAAQGLGLGRCLVQAAIAWSTARGAARLLLDTVPAAMPQATKLYCSLGFTDTARYNDNAVPGLRFQQLKLR